MKKIGIYKITNTLNNKMYIGSSINIVKRFRQHKLAGSDMVIHKAIRKYGVENFKFEILRECPVHCLHDIEEAFIILYKKVFGSNMLYNISDCGCGAPSRPKSEEHKRKIGLANKGKKRSAESIKNMSGENHHQWGRTPTESTRKKISEAVKIAQNKPEMLAMYSEQTKGKNNPRFIPTIYSFKNKKTGETFTGTMYDFKTTFNLLSHVHSLVKGKHKSVKGWVLT